MQELDLIVDVNSATKPPKPLGFKAYGSTPHLVGSRVGPADHSLTEKQSAIFLGKNVRRGDRVIVTEKCDGSCVSIARVGDDLLALQRAGYLAATSPYALHHAFDRWVGKRREKFMDILKDGERFVGEWLHTAMGTRYEIEDPDKLLIGFAHFSGQERTPYDLFVEKAGHINLPVAKVIHDGSGIPIEEALEILGANGFHGALDGIEGGVWVLESNGRFNSIAKFVKQDKVDGKYMSGITNAGDVINYIGEPF